jgi:hypothetical protein
MTMIMANKYHILELWDDLEHSAEVGLYKRLYASDKPFHIYGVYNYPQQYYGVAFAINQNIKNDIGNFENLKDLKISLTIDNLLVVQLLDHDKKDIFAALCENLIETVINLQSENKRIKTVLYQLERWKEMFERSNSNGLSAAEQQGLFGELNFLQKCLSKPNSDFCEVLRTWVGVDAALQDFVGENWSVEVKTTSANNPQKVIINGERQLDETFIEKLFLYHCVVSISSTEGKSLPQIIAEIRSQLSNDSMAITKFDSKLFEAGYFDKHSTLYNDRLYKIRKENIYRIDGNFPRIKENELREGVSAVKYSISLDNCNEYLIPENQLFV